MSCLRFGGQWELDSSGFELRRSGSPVRLERIPMEILLLLVEHRGELLTRESIAERVWGQGVFIDLDNGINGAIRKIRRALDDDPEHPLFIQTVTGKGYRFVAPVTSAQSVALETSAESIAPLIDEVRPEVPATQDVPAAQEVPTALEAPTAPRVAPTDRAGSRHRWLVPLAAAALLAAVGSFAYSSRQAAPAVASDDRVMLAVLPFENLTGDAGQEYFSEGLTEEMISTLGGIDPRRLGVIARASVMRYKTVRDPLERLGRELGVGYALAGGVRREAGRIRISAQLIRVEDQTQLWSRQYDRAQSDLLAVQEEIALAVAEQIRTTLADLDPVPNDPAPPLSADRYDAFDLYLQGRYSLGKRTPQALQSAVESFEQAIARDPTYARAYAGMADAYALMSGYSLEPQEKCMPRARAAAAKALELDPRLVEPHTALAVVAQSYDWNWEAAESEFQRALELDPNYATAHHWYAEHLALRGRFDEAFAEIERARRLDPLSLIIAADHAAILYFSRQHERAIRQWSAVLEMEPNFPRAYMLVYAYVEIGRFDLALATIEQWRTVDDDHPWIAAMSAYVHGRAGERAAAERAFADLQAFAPERSLDLSPQVVALIGMGDLDGALVLLRRSFEQRSPALTALRVDPIYDPLRRDPRFIELLRDLDLES